MWCIFTFSLVDERKSLNVGLTAHVIESSKETKVDASGVVMVKGTTTPSATATVIQKSTLADSYKATPEQLSLVKSLNLFSKNM